jgi:hypothetical protein
MRDDGNVTAQQVHDDDPGYPIEIMRILPAQHHEQFLAEYAAAAASARRSDRYRQLHHVLRLWRLRAAAYSDPDFDARLVAFEGKR